MTKTGTPTLEHTGTQTKLNVRFDKYVSKSRDVLDIGLTIQINTVYTAIYRVLPFVTKMESRLNIWKIFLVRTHRVIKYQRPDLVWF